ncbi:hypothetical protein HZC33_01270 [Candidatus Wolfebacteria bacterium]|nr:hypothetical protein [Candidatus Wolfebacteria bacterium]
MNLIKKSALILSILFFSFLILNFAFAQAGSSPVKSASDVYNILGKIVSWMYTIFFIVSVFFVLLAAFKFLTAEDDPEKIKGATKSIMWAAVAVVVALLSVGFGKIIESFITTP